MLAGVAGQEHRTEPSHVWSARWSSAASTEASLCRAPPCPPPKLCRATVELAWEGERHSAFSGAGGEDAQSFGHLSSLCPRAKSETRPQQRRLGHAGGPVSAEFHLWNVCGGVHLTCPRPPALRALTSPAAPLLLPSPCPSGAVSGLCIRRSHGPRFPLPVLSASSNQDSLCLLSLSVGDGVSRSRHLPHFSEPPLALHPRGAGALPGCKPTPE